MGISLDISFAKAGSRHRLRDRSFPGRAALFYRRAATLESRVAISRAAR
jgi:hypothetical protein